MKHPENVGTLGGTLHNVAGSLESRLKEVRQRKLTEYQGPNFDAHFGYTKTPTPQTPKHSSSSAEQQTQQKQNSAQPPPPVQPKPDDKTPGPGGYTLNSVKKIDIYSRRIFPCAYILFVLYFFIRYHHIEGALSVDY